MSPTVSTNSIDALNRTIDRFLAAQGWRVSRVTRRDDEAGYDVTLTQETGPDRGRSVTRTATSAGEATLKACSSARAIASPRAEEE